MLSNERVRAVAQAFADALDGTDFATVRATLGPTCHYDTQSALEGVLVGPAAIVESYRSHDARARQSFDYVEYSSLVETVDGMSALIQFTDVIRRQDHEHTYRCRQRIVIDEAAVIVSITQENIPAEVSAPKEFLTRVGETL